MYQAKLLKLDKFIEEEVLIEINAIKLVGFSTICPYKIAPHKTYYVKLGLTFLDDPEIIVIDEPQYNIERIRDTYGYILSGRVCDDCIEIGNGIKIQDDIFTENSYLNNLYIKLKIDRLSVEFV